jgi:hypothetical protein
LRLIIIVATPPPRVNLFRLGGKAGGSKKSKSKGKGQQLEERISTTRSLFLVFAFCPLPVDFFLSSR